jgi:cell division septation protein DedD
MKVVFLSTSCSGCSPEKLLCMVCLCAVFFLHFTTVAADIIYPEKTASDSMSFELQRAYKADTSDPAVMLAYAKSVRDAGIARSLYKKAAISKTAPDSIRAEAFYRLACMAYIASNYTKARSYCASAVKLSDSNIYAQLSMRSAMHDKKDSIDQTSAAVAVDSSNAVEKRVLDDKSGKKTFDGKYFLQVGAFTAVENAQGLKQELSRRFPQVSISAGNSNGKIVYRVRVGGFVNMETAKAFGDSALAEKKIPFRVIED